MARLCLLDENGHMTEHWDIGEAPVSVGRDATADVVIDDESLSRKHFVIKRQGMDFVVEDLGSVNGTWVDGLVAGTIPLREHVCIAAGRTIFLFSQGEVQPPELRTGTHG